MSVERPPASQDEDEAAKSAVGGETVPSEVKEEESPLPEFLRQPKGRMLFGFYCLILLGF
jgi:hypothetical protein